ncbi:MAG: hypothetical protein VB133_07180, partial [Anaeromusa sp.]|uniref:hypothetical protein n=1 Tax=Anaeromusa sp. TaxID=1872520 RepID=UPI002B2025D2
IFRKTMQKNNCFMSGFCVGDKGSRQEIAKRGRNGYVLPLIIGRAFIQQLLQGIVAVLRFYLGKDDACFFIDYAA